MIEILSLGILTYPSGAIKADSWTTTWPVKVQAHGEYPIVRLRIPPHETVIKDFYTAEIRHQDAVEKYQDAVIVYAISTRYRIQMDTKVRRSGLCLYPSEVHVALTTEADLLNKLTLIADEIFGDAMTINPNMVKNLRLHYPYIEERYYWPTAPKPWENNENTTT